MRYLTKLLGGAAAPAPSAPTLRPSAPRTRLESTNLAEIERLNSELVQQLALAAAATRRGDATALLALLTGPTTTTDAVSTRLEATLAGCCRLTASTAEAAAAAGVPIALIDALDALCGFVRGEAIVTVPLAAAARLESLLLSLGQHSSTAVFMISRTPQLFNLAIGRTMLADGDLSGLANTRRLRASALAAVEALIDLDGSKVAACGEAALGSAGGAITALTQRHTVADTLDIARQWQRRSTHWSTDVVADASDAAAAAAESGVLLNLVSALVTLVRCSSSINLILLRELSDSGGFEFIQRLLLCAPSAAALAALLELVYILLPIGATFPMLLQISVRLASPAQMPAALVAASGEPMPRSARDAGLLLSLVRNEDAFQLLVNLFRLLFTSGSSSESRNGAADLDERRSRLAHLFLRVYHAHPAAYALLERRHNLLAMAVNSLSQRYAIEAKRTFLTIVEFVASESLHASAAAARTGRSASLSPRSPSARSVFPPETAPLVALAPTLKLLGETLLRGSSSASGGGDAAACAAAVATTELVGATVRSILANSDAALFRRVLQRSNLLDVCVQLLLCLGWGSDPTDGAEPLSTRDRAAIIWCSILTDVIQGDEDAAAYVVASPLIGALFTTMGSTEASPRGHDVARVPLAVRSAAFNVAVEIGCADSQLTAWAAARFLELMRPHSLDDAPAVATLGVLHVQWSAIDALFRMMRKRRSTGGGTRLRELWGDMHGQRCVLAVIWSLRGSVKAHASSGGGDDAERTVLVWSVLTHLFRLMRMAMSGTEAVARGNRMAMRQDTTLVLRDGGARGEKNGAKEKTSEGVVVPGGRVLRGDGWAVLVGCLRCAGFLEIGEVQRTARVVRELFGLAATISGSEVDAGDAEPIATTCRMLPLLGPEQHVHFDNPGAAVLLLHAVDALRDDATRQLQLLAELDEMVCNAVWSLGGAQALSEAGLARWILQSADGSSQRSSGSGAAVQALVPREVICNEQHPLHAAFLNIIGHLFVHHIDAADLQTLCRLLALAFSADCAVVSPSPLPSLALTTTPSRQCLLRVLANAARQQTGPAGLACVPHLLFPAAIASSSLHRPPSVQIFVPPSASRGVGGAFASAEVDINASWPAACGFTVSMWTRIDERQSSAELARVPPVLLCIMSTDGLLNVRLRAVPLAGGDADAGAGKGAAPQLWALRLDFGPSSATRSSRDAVMSSTVSPVVRGKWHHIALVATRVEAGAAGDMSAASGSASPASSSAELTVHLDGLVVASVTIPVCRTPVPNFFFGDAPGEQHIPLTAGVTRESVWMQWSLGPTLLVAEAFTAEQVIAVLCAGPDCRTLHQGGGAAQQSHAARATALIQRLGLPLIRRLALCGQQTRAVDAARAVERASGFDQNTMQSQAVRQLGPLCAAAACGFTSASVCMPESVDTKRQTGLSTAAVARGAMPLLPVLGGCDAFVGSATLPTEVPWASAERFAHETATVLAFDQRRRAASSAPSPRHVVPSAGTSGSGDAAEPVPVAPVFALSQLVTAIMPHHAALSADKRVTPLTPGDGSGAALGGPSRVDHAMRQAVLTVESATSDSLQHQLPSVELCGSACLVARARTVQQGFRSIDGGVAALLPMVARVRSAGELALLLQIIGDVLRYDVEALDAFALVRGYGILAALLGRSATSAALISLGVITALFELCGADGALSNAIAVRTLLLHPRVWQPSLRSLFPQTKSSPILRGRASAPSASTLCLLRTLLEFTNGTAASANASVLLRAGAIEWTLHVITEGARCRAIVTGWSGSGADANAAADGETRAEALASLVQLMAAASELLVRLLSFTDRRSDLAVLSEAALCNGALPRLQLTLTNALGRAMALVQSTLRATSGFAVSSPRVGRGKDGIGAKWAASLQFFDIAGAELEIGWFESMIASAGERNQVIDAVASSAFVLLLAVLQCGPTTPLATRFWKRSLDVEEEEEEETQSVHETPTRLGGGRSNSFGPTQFSAVVVHFLHGSKQAVGALIALLLGANVSELAFDPLFRDAEIGASITPLDAPACAQLVLRGSSRSGLVSSNVSTVVERDRAAAVVELLFDMVAHNVRRSLGGSTEDGRQLQLLNCSIIQLLRRLRDADRGMQTLFSTSICLRAIGRVLQCVNATATSAPGDALLTTAHASVSRVLDASLAASSSAVPGHQDRLAHLLTELLKDIIASAFGNRFGGAARGGVATTFDENNLEDNGRMKIKRGHGGDAQRNRSAASTRLKNVHRVVQDVIAALPSATSSVLACIAAQIDSELIPRAAWRPFAPIETFEAPTNEKPHGSWKKVLTKQQIATIGVCATPAAQLIGSLSSVLAWHICAQLKQSSHIARAAVPIALNMLRLLLRLLSEARNGGQSGEGISDSEFNEGQVFASMLRPWSTSLLLLQTASGRALLSSARALAMSLLMATLDDLCTTSAAERREENASAGQTAKSKSRADLNHVLRDLALQLDALLPDTPSSPGGAAHDEQRRADDAASILLMSSAEAGGRAFGDRRTLADARASGSDSSHGLETAVEIARGTAFVRGILWRLGPLIIPSRASEPAADATRIASQKLLRGVLVRRPAECAALLFAEVGAAKSGAESSGSAGAALARGSMTPLDAFIAIPQCSLVKGFVLLLCPETHKSGAGATAAVPAAVSPSFGEWLARSPDAQARLVARLHTLGEIERTDGEDWQFVDTAEYARSPPGSPLEEVSGPVPAATTSRLRSFHEWRQEVARARTRAAAHRWCDTTTRTTLAGVRAWSELWRRMRCGSGALQPWTMRVEKRQQKLSEGSARWTIDQTEASEGTSFRLRKRFRLVLDGLDAEVGIATDGANWIKPQASEAALACALRGEDVLSRDDFRGHRAWGWGWSEDSERVLRSITARDEEGERNASITARDKTMAAAFSDDYWMISAEAARPANRSLEPDDDEASDEGDDDGLHGDASRVDWFARSGLELLQLLSPASGRSLQKVMNCRRIQGGEAKRGLLIVSSDSIYFVEEWRRTTLRHTLQKRRRKRAAFREAAWVSMSSRLRSSVEVGPLRTSTRTDDASPLSTRSLAIALSTTLRTRRKEIAVSRDEESAARTARKRHRLRAQQHEPRHKQATDAACFNWSQGTLPASTDAARGKVNSDCVDMGAHVMTGALLSAFGDDAFAAALDSSWLSGCAITSEEESAVPEEMWVRAERIAKRWQELMYNTRSRGVRALAEVNDTFNEHFARASQQLVKRLMGSEADEEQSERVATAAAFTCSYIAASMAHEAAASAAVFASEAETALIGCSASSHATLRDDYLTALGALEVAHVHRACAAAYAMHTAATSAAECASNSARVWAAASLEASESASSEQSELIKQASQKALEEAIRDIVAEEEKAQAIEDEKILGTKREYVVELRHLRSLNAMAAANLSGHQSKAAVAIRRSAQQRYRDLHLQAHSVRIPLLSIKEIQERRYMLRPDGIEVLVHGDSHLFVSMRTAQLRSEALRAIDSAVSKCRRRHSAASVDAPLGGESGGVASAALDASAHANLGASIARGTFLRTGLSKGESSSSTSTERGIVEDSSASASSLLSILLGSGARARWETHLQEAMRLWQQGLVTNLEYLMVLNFAAGRSYLDFTQYPVLPWVVDYDALTTTATDFDVRNARHYRDLSKPMGALSSKRRKRFVKRFKSLQQEPPPDGSGPYHYGTHYSCCAYVLNFLIRVEPFTSHARELQGGHFDHADRLFLSIEAAWASASRANDQDVRELLPEIYSLPEMFVNSDQLALGKLQSTGENVNHVLLPVGTNRNSAVNFNDPMTRAQLFILHNRAALESPIASAMLHRWIDLVFGVAQTGDKAREAINCFHPFTYEQMDLDAIADPVRQLAASAQVLHYGQTPRCLFKGRHPSRRKLAVKLPDDNEDAQEEGRTALDVLAEHQHELAAAPSPPLAPRALDVDAIGVAVRVVKNLVGAARVSAALRVFTIVVTAQGTPAVDEADLERLVAVYGGTEDLEQSSNAPVSATRYVPRSTSRLIVLPQARCRGPVCDLRIRPTKWQLASGTRESSSGGISGSNIGGSFGEGDSEARHGHYAKRNGSKKRPGIAVAVSHPVVDADAAGRHQLLLLPPFASSDMDEFSATPVCKVLSFGFFDGSVRVHSTISAPCKTDDPLLPAATISPLVGASTPAAGATSRDGAAAMVEEEGGYGDDEHAAQLRVKLLEEARAAITARRALASSRAVAVGYCGSVHSHVHEPTMDESHSTSSWRAFRASETVDDAPREQLGKNTSFRRTSLSPPLAGKGVATSPCRRSQGGVLALALSDDATMLVSGGSDATIAVWTLEMERSVPLRKRSGIAAALRARRLQTKHALSRRAESTDISSATQCLGRRTRLLARLCGHGGAVGCVALSTNYGFIVGGDTSGTVSVWDSTRFTLVRQLIAHSAEVSVVSINHASGTYVSISAEAGELRLWSVNGEPLAEASVSRATALGVAALAIGSGPSALTSSPLYANLPLDALPLRARFAPVNRSACRDALAHGRALVAGALPAKRAATPTTRKVFSPKQIAERLIVAGEVNREAMRSAVHEEQALAAAQIIRAFDLRLGVVTCATASACPDWLFGTVLITGHKCGAVVLWGVDYFGTIQHAIDVALDVKATSGVFDAHAGRGVGISIAAPPAAKGCLVPICVNRTAHAGSSVTAIWLTADGAQLLSGDSIGRVRRWFKVTKGGAAVADDAATDDAAEGMLR